MFQIVGYYFICRSFLNQVPTSRATGQARGDGIWRFCHLLSIPGLSFSSLACVGSGRCCQSRALPSVSALDRCYIYIYVQICVHTYTWA